MSARATDLKPPGSSPWVFNPAVDLLVGCGAWSLPLLVLTLYFTQQHANVVATLFYLLAVFCNQPHYMATVYRAYRTAGDFHKYRFFTVYVTVLALLTALIVHFVPSLFPWLLTLYLTWSPWHYTGQNYGIAMMLARRAGAAPNDETRQLLWWSYFASYAAWFLAMHHADAANLPGLHLLPIPEDYARLGKFFFLLVYLLAGGLGHWRLARALGWRALAGPLTLHATQFLWFLLPEILRETTALQLPESYASAGILAFMHCAQYLWITSYYARRETEASAANPPATAARPRPRFRWGSYYFLLVLGGIALFLPAPWLASRVLGHDLVESILIFTALINLHHFILDGAIWKLRDGRIARLLLGRNPPAGEHQHPEEASGWLPLARWLTGPAFPARLLRYGSGAALLGLAALDQTQFWLTQRSSGPTALALAQKINPQDTRIYYQRAKALLAANDTPGAIAQLRQAVALNEHNLPSQHLLGELLFRTNDAAAPAHYDRMAELFPDDPAVLLNSGLLAHRAGDHARAIVRFEAALRLPSPDPRLHLYLGNAREKSGDPAKAIHEYKFFLLTQGAADGPALPATTVLPLYLKIGELHARQGQTAEADSWYEQAVKLAREQNLPAEAATAEAARRALQPVPTNAAEK